jgi:hypothetical protein
VNVLYGSDRGLTAAGNQYWTQDSPGIKGKALPGNSFGSTLAAANFGKSLHADLAIGASTDYGTRGAVNVIYGSSGGLAAAGNQYWTQDSPGIKGKAATSEGFGSALAPGDFDGNGFADLAVGAPGDTGFRGSVNIIHGSAHRLTAAGNQYWTQDSPSIKGKTQHGDSFGSALSTPAH